MSLLNPNHRQLPWAGIMKLSLKSCDGTSSLFKSQKLSPLFACQRSSHRPWPSVFFAARGQRSYPSRHLDSEEADINALLPLPATRPIFVAPKRKTLTPERPQGTAKQHTNHSPLHTQHPTHKNEAMGRITCSECDFGGCRDSCLDDHELEFACHNKLCPLHIEYFVAVRHGKFLRRGKRSSTRRRESEDVSRRSSDRPRHSSDRPRHSSRRNRSSSRRRSGGDRLFNHVMDRVMRRRDTTTVDDGDGNRGRGPTVSVRVRQSTRHVRPDDDDDNGGPGPSTSARIRRGTRYVRTQDDSDSCSSSSSCSTWSSDSDEPGREWKSGGKRESRGRRETTGRPSSSHQYSSSSSTRPPPPPAGYSGYQGSSRRRSPRPSTPRPASYPTGGAGPSSYPGGNDRRAPEPPSPPLKTNWGVHARDGRGTPEPPSPPLKTNWGVR